MQKVLNSIEKLAEQAANNEGDPELVTPFAEAAKILAEAYMITKEVEIHEKFHISHDFSLPGEEPIPGKN